MAAVEVGIGVLFAFDNIGCDALVVVRGSVVHRLDRIGVDVVDLHILCTGRFCRSRFRCIRADLLKFVALLDRQLVAELLGDNGLVDVQHAAIQGDLALLRDWECIFVIFQQNHALCGNVPGKFCIADLAFGHFVRGRSRKGRRHS